MNLQTFFVDLQKKNLLLKIVFEVGSLALKNSSLATKLNAKMMACNLN